MKKLISLFVFLLFAAASVQAQENTADQKIFNAAMLYQTQGNYDDAIAGFSRFIAALEAFTGTFTIPLFVVVFVKKMTR